jgi:hypothetical protein
MAPMLLCAANPAPSPSESGPRMRSSPSAASRPARLGTPSLAARVVKADRRVGTQAVLPQPSGSCLQTHWLFHLPLQCRPETVPELFSEVFACPGLAAPSQSPQKRGQSSGGSPVEICLHPWLGVKPVGCTLASLYSPCI